MRTLYLIQKLKLSSSLPIRWLSSQAEIIFKDEVQSTVTQEKIELKEDSKFSSRASLKLKDEIASAIAEEKIKIRNHPGIIKTKRISLPEWIVQAMNERFDGANRTEIYKERINFENYLFCRRLPLEQHELRQKYLDIEGTYLENKIDDATNPEEIEQMRLQVKGRVIKKLKQQVFAWKPLNYNHYRSLLYMITRSTGEYSALYNIFQEISIRDPNFNPSTMFDFGSGVGSALWAANAHWKNMSEYLGIDISNDMINLAEAIMSYSPKKIRALLYRQYLPVSNLKHELIVSAYSLMELPDAKHRLDVLSKLWRKTSKYLVIVEQGSNAGFKEKLVNEAKHFIKYMTERIDKKINYSIFAPCPHEQSCPRYEEGKTPCNFLAQYQSLPLLGPSDAKNELYSYVVFKKGERTNDHDWYRVVRPTQVRKKHVRCSLCTSSGKLEEVVFTPTKHGKPLYRCAKATSWGNRLPIDTTSQDNISNNFEEQKLNSIASEDKENDDVLKTEVDDKSKKEKIFCSEAAFPIKSNEIL